MKKRGLSEIVTTLIMILLVFVAIGIVWYVVQNVLNEGSDEITLDSLTLDLEIQNVNLNTGEVSVKRNPGAGEINGVRVVIFDGSNSESIDSGDIVLEELSTVNLDLVALGYTGNLGDIKKISIAPTYRTATGEFKLGAVKDEMNFVSGGGTPPASYNCVLTYGGTCQFSCGTGYNEELAGTCETGVCCVEENIIPICSDNLEIFEGCYCGSTVVSSGYCCGETNYLIGPCPVLTFGSVSNSVPGSVYITWTSDVDCTGAFEYGLTQDYELGSVYPLLTPFGKYHAVQLVGLTPDTTYFYRLAGCANGCGLLEREFETIPICSVGLQTSEQCYCGPTSCDAGRYCCSDFSCSNIPCA